MVHSSFNAYVHLPLQTDIDLSAAVPMLIKISTLPDSNIIWICIGNLRMMNHGNVLLFDIVIIILHLLPYVKEIPLFGKNRTKEAIAIYRGFHYTESKLFRYSNQLRFHSEPVFEKITLGGGVVGKVFQIQRFSLYDGPGVRTVVFLKGCPLHCIWCHNPEGLSGKQQILYSPNRCIGCMDCVAACSVGCHTQITDRHIFNRADCTGCGACARQCCTGALSIAGMDMTPEAVMEQVLRDREVFLESGGGLTISGGEPFAQPEFTIRLLQLAKQAGIHTAVETSGYTTREIIREAAQVADLFLYDYKVTDNVLHKKLCGVSNDQILSNLALLDTLGAEVILRCPIIPGQNDTPDHICGIGMVAADHTCIKQVHLEPYHRLGIDKAEQLGLDSVFETIPPDKFLMEQYCGSIQSRCGKPAMISF